MPPQAAKGQRNYLKCEFCRWKKRKCEPEIRDWEGVQEKCHNCVQAGNPCGPNVLYSAPSSSPPATHAPSFSHHAFTSATTYVGNTAARVTALPPTDCSPHFDRARGKARAPTVSETNPEARTPSTKETVRTRLNELGKLSELYSYLRHRQDAVAHTRPPRQTQQYEDMYGLVTTVLDYTQQKYAHTCDRILDSLPHMSKSDRELCLRIFVDKISYFVSMSTMALQTSVEQDGDDFIELKCIHCGALSQLAALCEEAGDQSDAYRLRCQLENFSHIYNISDIECGPVHETKAFRDMSLRVSDAFQSLRIPNHYARLLPTASNMFPASHLAMHAGQQLTAHSILAEHLGGIEERDILCRQTLHIAAEVGDFYLLQRALSERATAHADVDVFKMTPLCIAAYAGNEDFVTSLIEYGSDPLVTDITGRSVLSIAAGNGHLGIVKCLLDRGHRPNATRPFGPSGSYSALHAAAAAGHTEIAELLVQHGASALLLSNGLTPAEEAADHGHEVLARSLHRVEAEQRAAFPQQLESSERAMHHAFLTTIGSDDFLTRFTTSPGSFMPQPIAAPLGVISASAQSQRVNADTPHPSPLLLSGSVSESSSAMHRPRKRARPASCHPTPSRMSPALSELSSRTSSTNRTKSTVDTTTKPPARPQDHSADPARRLTPQASDQAH